MSDLFVLVKDDVRVTLEDIGEGWNGDAEPGEATLIRFAVETLVDGEWEPVENSSYCTTVPTTAERLTLERMADAIMREVFDLVKRRESVKRVCEKLSWLSEESLSKDER